MAAVLVALTEGSMRDEQVALLRCRLHTVHYDVLDIMHQRINRGVYKTTYAVLLMDVTFLEPTDRHLGV